jgi:glycosyltransferase involved in cell wall biosynthesis
MKFSIVIPTYNEESDIRGTLDSLMLLDYPNYEILVVDDSTDSTPNIVSEYQKFGVKLFRPSKRDGRCAARNLGILNADGDVVVILNADVRLPVNFLQKIKMHYDNSADYVLVRSVVENLEDLFARYVEAVGVYDFYGSNPQSMDWSEGFSCRRDLAIRAGLFPTGFAVPLVAGEDKVFGENLRYLNANKVIDLNIVCAHIAPASFLEYWNIRKGRGQGSPQVRRFLDGWTYSRILRRACYRLMKNVLYLSLLAPMLIVCYRYSQKSPRGAKDLLPFCWAWIIEKAAFSVGEFKEIKNIHLKERHALKLKVLF